MRIIRCNGYHLLSTTKRKKQITEEYIAVRPNILKIELNKANGNFYSKITFRTIVGTQFEFVALTKEEHNNLLKEELAQENVFTTDDIDDAELIDDKE